MAELGEVRERDGVYEILVGKAGSAGDYWKPYGTSLVEARYLTAPNGLVYGRTIAEELRAEGWIGPDDELELCQNFSRLDPAHPQCRLWRGHEGNHRAGGTEWEDGY